MSNFTFVPITEIENLSGFEEISIRKLNSKTIIGTPHTLIADGLLESVAEQAKIVMDKPCFALLEGKLVVNVRDKGTVTVPYFFNAEKHDGLTESTPPKGVTNVTLLTPRTKSANRIVDKFHITYEDGCFF